MRIFGFLIDPFRGRVGPMLGPMFGQTRRNETQRDDMKTRASGSDMPENPHETISGTTGHNSRSRFSRPERHPPCSPSAASDRPHAEDQECPERSFSRDAAFREKAAS